MERRTRSKLGLLGVLLAASVAGCSSPGASGAPQPPIATDANHGGVELGLVPVAGVTLSVIHFVVTNSATPPVVISEGDLPATGSGAQISLGISLPVGTGYRVSLSADSAETGDRVTCGRRGRSIRHFTQCGQRHPARTHLPRRHLGLGLAGGGSHDGRLSAPRIRLRAGGFLRWAASMSCPSACAPAPKISTASPSRIRGP